MIKMLPYSKLRRYLFEERVSIMLLGALFLLVVGAVLAGFADLSEVHQ